MREYFLIALVAGAVTYLLVPLVRVFAIRIGAMPEVRERDVHTTPTPRLGGLAMYGGLVAGLLFATKQPWVAQSLADPDLAGGQTVTALLAAGGLITLTGFLDDWWGMDPFIKLGGQIASAGLLVAFGLYLTWIPVPGTTSVALDSTLRTIITILVVVVAINAVNFVDGLDGLAAGIVGIAAMAMWVYSIVLSTTMGDTRINATAAITSVLIGICAGFLPHNFHPAKIFMGDTGAMLIGLVLASSVVTVTPIDPSALSPTINRFPLVLPLLLPVAVMVLPLLDLWTAVVRRTSYGMSPFAPDRGHLHHRLLDVGHSHRRTVLIMYAWTFLFGFAVVGASINGFPLIVFVAIVILALVVLLLMALPRWRERRRGGGGGGGGGAHAAGHRRRPGGDSPSGPAPEPMPGPQVGPVGGPPMRSPVRPPMGEAPPVPPTAPHTPPAGPASGLPPMAEMGDETAVIPLPDGPLPGLSSRVTP
ncbi:MraY family glycosyltransferase [Spongiactinospora sp. TRM90649]|uniref:glycosyltransferase family 4 protein n=1 Tax=Spongiactinospora sp. TRM90649 TaxID=3031114 RepID=UPI0023F96A0D|nr:MraY family glycosyltransferase [Spongiactinospora sp. TRM90649]MDF5752543.1 MraY family glycosyltransferase [Spongiactinospora sp. TRM90649]